MEMKGVYTAIVTPFSGGEVDYKKLVELIEFQILAKVDGESPALTMDEHIKVIDTVVTTVKSRCMVIAGTGANSTAEAIHLTKMAKKAGADASLQVTPYYNKPTQEGLYRHFSTIADVIGLPIVIYNVPGRSAVSVAPETIARLAKNNNIVSVKEAGGSAERVSAILDLCDITILSGDDALTLPMMAVGAKGVISVASNIVPRQVKQMVDFFLAGNAGEAEKIHRRLYPLFRDLFIETNPLPIKAAMAIKGMIEESFRLPMCPMSDKNREILAKTLDKVLKS